MTKPRVHVEMCWYCDDGETPATHLVWNVPGRPDGCCDAHAATCRDSGDRVTPLMLQAAQSGARTLTAWGWVTPR